MANTRKAEKYKKKNVITIKCSDDEKKQFMKNAEKNGMSLSSYMCSAAMTNKKSLIDLNREITAGIVEVTELTNILNRAIKLNTELDELMEAVENLESGVNKLWRC